MELVGMKDRIVVQANAVQLKPITFGQCAQLLKAFGTWLPRLQEHGVDHRRGIANDAKYVVVAM